MHSTCKEGKDLKRHSHRQRLPKKRESEPWRKKDNECKSKKTNRKRWALTMINSRALTLKTLT